MSARLGIVLLVALPALLALAPGAVAADEPSGRPSIPIVSTTSDPPATSAPPSHSSSAPASVSPTHRATSSSPSRTRTTASRRVTSTRSAEAPYSISEAHTGGPTQTFVLGTGSLGSLSDSSIPTVAASPTSAGSSQNDGTDHYVQLFFGVIVAAALLLAAGLTGLVLTRDGRRPGGRHR